MTDAATKLPIPMGHDEKCISVMAYTATNICMGDVVIKEKLRGSTWLRTNAAPDSVCLFNARVLNVNNTGTPKQLLLPELHISVAQIHLFHLVPPAQDPLDYDINEPNRKLEPITLLCGSFRIDGKIRISTQSTLAKYVELTRETFTSLYDAEISCSLLPALGIIKVPYTIVRQSTSMFAARPA
ncbi:MAG: hypothetical protein P4L50_25585 [Anaerolineaceae bacterium]|nr:hypothetical protein [Anaerolineaceae bacterium]